jgi:hypothetical protein
MRVRWLLRKNLLKVEFCDVGAALLAGEGDLGGGVVGFF